MASSLKVGETLIRFAKSRQLLRDVYASARGHFDQLRSILCDEFVHDSKMFLSDDDLAVLEMVLDNDPVIIVSGQSNCGKSSLINELLGGTYLPTPAIACKARIIVRVRYSEIKYLQVFDSENKELCERIELQKKKVPLEKIYSEFSSRAEKDIDCEVECVVEVGLDNELLRHGLQIIDVPGLSENTALDKLVNKHLNGMLQLVIYVIDGKTSLRTQDKDFISHLKTTAPMAEILFVCNEVEDDSGAWEMDRASDEERPDRAKLAFGELKKAGLLPSGLQYSTELQYYHGLSCSIVRKARRAKKPREDLEKFVKNLDRFKDALLKTFSRCVNKHLYRAVSGLLGCQRRVFDFLISGKMTKLTKMDVLKYIQVFLDEEKLGKDLRSYLAATAQIQNMCQLKERQAHEDEVMVNEMIPAYSKNLCITNALANTLRHGVVQLGKKIGQGSRSDVFECQTYMDLQNIVAKKSKFSAEIPNNDFCTLSCYYVRLLRDYEFQAKVTAVAFDSLWHFCVILPRYERNLYDLLSQDDHGLSLEERVTMCYEMAKLCDYCTKRGLTLNDLRPNNFFVRTTNSKLSLAFNLSKWKDMSAPYPDGKPPFHFAPEVVLEKILSHKTFDAYSLTVLLVLLAIGKIVRPKFSENEETIKEIQASSEKDYVGRLRDDFLKIWEENWEDKEHCVYSIIRSFINTYIGTIPSDRMGVEKFMHDVKHILLKRLNDRTPDMNSSSASSDDHDSITRSTTVPDHYAAEYDVNSGPPQRRLQHYEESPQPITCDFGFAALLRFGNDASSSAGPSSLEVSETLIRFAKSRQLLRDVYASARGHFDQLRAILRDELVRAATEQDDSEMFLSDDDLAVLEMVLANDPVIIVSGRTNCGKTSLINELLGGTYLPTSAIPCTARIVRVRYSKINYLQVFDSENKELCERIEFQKKKLPEDKINLEFSLRAEKDMVECEVEVGLNNELLRHGLQIIDFPGHSENTALDKLVGKHLDGMLQLVIYVIDGTKSLTIQDTTFISHLKATAPMAEIMFVCNKVEDDPEARKMDRFYGVESDEGVERPNRAELAFGRLRKAGLLRCDLQYSTELQYYHGLSCSFTREARLAREPRKDLEEYVKNFDRFKDALLKTFRRCVNKHLYRAVSSLLGCQQRVFDFFISDKMTFFISDKVTGVIKSELFKHNEVVLEGEKLGKDLRSYLVATAQIMNLCQLKERLTHEYEGIVSRVIPAYSKNLCITDALTNTLRHGVVQLGKKIGQGSRSDVFECQTYMDLQNIVAKKSKVSAEIPSDDFCTLSCYVRLLRDYEFHAKVTAVAFDSLWHFCVILPKYERNLYDLLASDDHGLSLEERVTMCYGIAKMCEYSAKQGLRLNDLRPNNFFVDTAHGKITPRFNFSKWKDMSAPYPDGKPPFHFAPEVVLEKSLTPKTFDAYSLTVLLVQLAIGKIVRPKFSENEETIKEIQTLPEEDYIRRLRDDFLQIWEENWEDKEHCVYSIIRSFINKYIGTNPSDRKGVETYMHDVKHILLRRLNDRTPDINSSLDDCMLS